MSFRAVHHKPNEYLVYLRKPSDIDPSCRGPFAKKITKEGRQAAYFELPHDATGIRTVRAYYIDGAREWAKRNGIVCPR